jgi:hypothetical protein
MEISRFSQLIEDKAQHSGGAVSVTRRGVTFAVVGVQRYSATGERSRP